VSVRSDACEIAAESIEEREALVNGHGCDSLELRLVCDRFLR
jgi:hypothetical protein